jgi:hypothetical protein
LADGFGLLIERGNGESFVSLIGLDLYNVTCKKFQTVEYRCWDLKIILNKLDSAEFVLNLLTFDGSFARICNVIGNKIIVGDVFELLLSFQAYFDGRFYYLHSFGDQVFLFLAIHLILYYCRKSRFSFITSSREVWRCSKLIFQKAIT